MSARAIASRPPSRAQKSASISASRKSATRSDSFPECSASRAACSTIRATASRSRARRPSRDAIEAARRAKTASFSGVRSKSILKVDQNLEVLADIRVQRVKQEIEQAIAEQHDLHSQWNGIGIERDRAGQAEEAADVLDRDLPTFQRAFERGPAKWLHQEAARVQKQVTAARPMEGARLDQLEIGHKDAMR